MAAAGFLSATSSPRKARRRGNRGESSSDPLEGQGDGGGGGGGGGGGKRRGSSHSFLKAIFLRKKRPSVKDSLAVVGLRKALLIGE